MLLIGLLLSVAVSVAATPGGIGGTGIEPGGIGGTGINPGGIGGTGIVAIGPVQRFGSIFVNGGEYELPSETRYRVDGSPADARSVHLGDMVRVNAVDRGGRLDAIEVRIDHALIGRITQIDSTENRLIVLGQTVQLQPSTLLRTVDDKPLHPAALAVGDVVRISGLDQGAGRWQAMRLVQLTGSKARGKADNRFLLRGTLEATRPATRQVHIGGAWLTVAPGAWPALPAVGSRVLVRGLQGGGGDVITAVEREHAVEAPVGTRLVMVGYVRSQARGLESHGLRVQGASALLNAQLESAASVQTGGPALIEGVLLDARTVVVDRVIAGVDAMRWSLPPLAGSQSDAAKPKAAETSQGSAGISGADLAGRVPQVPTVTAPMSPNVMMPNITPPTMPVVPQVPQMPNPISPPTLPQPPSVTTPSVSPPNVGMPTMPGMPQVPSLPRP